MTSVPSKPPSISFEIGAKLNKISKLNFFFFFIFLFFFYFLNFEWIVLADANFPTSSTCRDGAKEIRADGHSIAALLEAILQLMPLDAYCWSPVLIHVYHSN